MGECRPLARRWLAVQARRLAVLVGIIGALLFIGAPQAFAAPVISTVNPPGLVLAGSTVFVNASGLDPSGTVTFHWDGILAPDTATADGSGAIAGAPVVVPTSLHPGPHNLAACAGVAGCSPSTEVDVGPTVSTTATPPLHRGSSIPVTVSGLPGGAGQKAIFGWNGVFDAATAFSVPDMPSFTTNVTVPSNAPATSVLDVCQQLSGTSCVTSPQTNATLAIAVVVPVPPPSPPVTSTTTVSVSSSATPSASTSPSTSASTSAPAKSAHRSVTPSPSPTLTLPTVTPAPPAPPAPPTVQPPTAVPVATALFTPKAVVHLEVAGFALLALLGGQSMFRGIAGLAVPGEYEIAGSGAFDESGQLRRPHGGKATSAKVKDIGRTLLDLHAAGDHSRTWRWPGTARLDALAITVPVRIAPRSPLLARVLVDSSYLRAMFGSLSLALPLLGVILGALALSSTHAHAVPPSLGLLAALAVLGVIDAFSGAIGALLFVAGVALTGNVDSAIALRTVLGLGVIWFAVPLIAGAARPLRRRWENSTQAYRQRIGDVVIASLIGAWAVQKMVLALPGLAQAHLAIAHHADLIAWLVLAASALRILLETATAHLYPRRLASVQPAKVPKSGTVQRIAASVVRTAIFLFVVVAFIGNHWQLWVGGVLFLVPQLVSICENRLRNSERLYAVLPRGLFKLVFMLFVGAAFGAFMLHVLRHAHNVALDAFVVLTIPGLVIGALELFGREGHDPEEGWRRWLAGVAILIVGVFFVFGYLNV